MFTNIAVFRFKNVATAFRAFAEGLLSGEINFRRSGPGLAFSFRLWLALFEFKANVFFVVHHEKCFERSAFTRDKTLQQIGSAGGEHFFHLLAVHRSLQNDFARSKVARFVWAA